MMRHVIIGNGITGITAARTIRQLDDDAEIIVISDESPYFFARTALMWVYMRQLPLSSLEPYERREWDELRITHRQGRVTGIDPESKNLTFDQGDPLSYDRLLLTVGGKPAMFGWPGQDLEGVCNMTTLGDLGKLEAVRPRLKRAVVAGGGLIGLEMVEMMLHDHVPVTFLIREPWYWHLMLSREEGEIVHQRIRSHGVNLVLEDEVKQIQGTEQGQVAAVITKGGQTLPCELVGFATGVQANTDLARSSGIACARGIQIDRSMCTDQPDIFAAGDCAELQWGDGTIRLEQLWYSGIRQGQAAGRAMLGYPVNYDPGVPYNSAQFLFLDYLNVGWMSGARFAPPDHLGGMPEEGLGEFFFQAEGHPESIRIAHRPDGSRPVLGFSMLGPRWDSEVLIRWIEQRRPLDWVLGNLSQASFNEEFRPNRFKELPTHA